MLFSMIEKRLRRPCRGQIFEKFDKQVLLTKNEIQIDSPQEDSLGATQWQDGLRTVVVNEVVASAIKQLMQFCYPTVRSFYQGSTKPQWAVSNPVFSGFPSALDGELWLAASLYSWPQE